MATEVVLPISVMGSFCFVNLLAGSRELTAAVSVRRSDGQGAVRAAMSSVLGSVREVRRHPAPVGMGSRRQGESCSTVFHLI